MMEYSFCHPDYSSKWSYRSSAGKLHGSFVLKCLLGILKWKKHPCQNFFMFGISCPNLKLFITLLWMDQLISAWLRFPWPLQAMLSDLGWCGITGERISWNDVGMRTARSHGNVCIFSNITCPWSFLHPLLSSCPPPSQAVQGLLQSQFKV